MKILITFGHLSVISGCKWDYTFYRWGFVSTYNWKRAISDLYTSIIFYYFLSYDPEFRHFTAVGGAAWWPSQHWSHRRFDLPPCRLCHVFLQYSPRHGKNHTLLDEIIINIYKTIHCNMKSCNLWIVATTNHRFSSQWSHFMWFNLSKRFQMISSLEDRSGTHSATCRVRLPNGNSISGMVNVQPKRS